MNLIEVPSRSKQLEITRTRLTKAFDLAAQRQDAKRGNDAERDAKYIEMRDDLINAILESFDECGFFVAYVGDQVKLTVEMTWGETGQKPVKV